MTRRIRSAACACAFVTALGAAEPRSQSASPADLKTSIDQLGQFKYPVRMHAARTVRRAPAAEAVPALVEAVGRHRDEYVRFRSLVLLTGFNDRRTADVMRSVLRDRSDRLRQVAYGWFERHPDATMTSVLLPALETELAEFVRPALVRALAALGSKDSQVRAALVRGAGRGLDIFRSAVIDALGEHRADYALDTLAAIAKLEGPLQDDAVLALGRIGDKRAWDLLPEIGDAAVPLQLTIRGTRCLLGDADCPVHIGVLMDAVTADQSPNDAVRAAATALSAIAARGDRSALDALANARPARERQRRHIALALSAAALRNPTATLQWLERTSEVLRTAGIDLLRDGLDMLEEDLAEESLYAAARAAYWEALEGSAMRTMTAALIQKLDF